MRPESATGCCGRLGVKSHPHPMCPSAGAWLPVGARGHMAAVPRLPLGCGVPARVWILSGGYSWRRGCRYGLGSPGTRAGQVLGLFLGGWKGEGDPVGLIARWSGISLLPSLLCIQYETNQMVHPVSFLQLTRHCETEERFSLNTLSSDGTRVWDHPA